MKTSINYKMVTETTDEQFLSYLMYLRSYNIEAYEYKIISDMINDRLSTMGYSIEWGCCGTNKITKLK